MATENKPTIPSLVRVADDLYLNPSILASATYSEDAEAWTLTTRDGDEYEVSPEEWTAAAPLLAIELEEVSDPDDTSTEEINIAFRDGYEQGLKARQQYITESIEESAARVRLANLWAEKNEAREAYMVARFDDYAAAEAFAKAADAYASAACGYIAGLRFSVPTLPQPVVEAVTNVELARAKNPDLIPAKQLADLYHTCRNELDNTSKSEK